MMSGDVLLDMAYNKGDTEKFIFTYVSTQIDNGFHDCTIFDYDGNIDHLVLDVMYHYVRDNTEEAFVVVDLEEVI